MAKVVVTGGNRGIGLELVRQLAQRGDEAVAVCRSPSPELTALGVRVESGVDVSDDASVRDLAERLSGERIDVLINNAGILRHDALGGVDFARVRDQIEVNALGPLRITQALLGGLGRGSKVALITSRMGSIADNSSGAMYGYRMSKAALNAAGMSLARDLQSRGVAVIILHPGYVRTEMTGGGGNVDAAEAASNLIARIDELTPETSGSFRHANGEVLPW
jgi:NAD(P)-dependent dehydrogenase (short-subunit alcohol dehydrogenase family)